VLKKPGVIILFLLSLLACIFLLHSCGKEDDSSSDAIGFDDPPPDDTPTECGIEQSLTGCSFGTGTCNFDTGFYSNLYDGGTPAGAPTCATTYYVDYSGGSDGAAGTTTGTAWQTIDRVESFGASPGFNPGDCILFKRGEAWWNSRFDIPSSGTSGNPITIGAYGTGAQPIISSIMDMRSWDVEGNWTHQGNNIWLKINEIDYPSRIWIDDVEIRKAKVLADIDSTWRWFWDFDNAWFYLYSVGNPATTYTTFKRAWGQNPPIYTNKQDYISIRDIEARAGNYSIIVEESDNIIIEDCTIGWGANIGIFVHGTTGVSGSSSDNGIIRRNIIDSGYRGTYYYEKAQSEDGVHLRGGANNWEICQNWFKAWGHNAISLWQHSDGENKTVNNNIIYSNKITGEGTSYGRGYGTVGRRGECSYNEFKWNLLEDLTMPNQIGGDYNTFNYNIVDTVLMSVIDGEKRGGAGIVLTPSASGHPEFVSEHNEVKNNVVYNCEHVGIEAQDWSATYLIKYNTVQNNIVLNNIQGYDYPEFEGVNFIVGGCFDPDAEITGRDNTFDGNIIWNGSNGNVVFYRGERMCVSKFQEKDSDYGDTIINNYQMAPLFTDPANGDFSFQPSSPCN
jgi:hypothetical protein